MGVNHEVNSPKISYNFPKMTMGQHWLGKTKFSDQPKTLSKSSYRIKKNIFNGIFY